MSKKVVNYDGYDYDYTQYWKDREYENNAEHLVLDDFLKDEQGSWFIDIGGSYGRLADTYANKFEKCIVLDYSLKTLKANSPIVKEKFPNVTFIAANAYKMPFKANSFDGGLMVRVLHHIERQKEYFTELSRILKDDSIYIQEFANKIHLKARIRALLKRDTTLLDKNPLQQPTINMEGSRDGDVSFLNYHPEYVKKIMEECKIEIEEAQGCSYLRIPIFKKLLGANLLTLLEEILQRLLPHSNIPPSIFLKTEIDKEDENTPSHQTLQQILACPKCKNSLRFGENVAVCNNCQRDYIKSNNIWDFRVE
ncbi:class I SAM-dependent methyltransferase [bacterium]|nr:class I SAM-dependent methyltransferase [bacterium]